MTQTDTDIIIQAIVVILSMSIGFYGGITAIHIHKRKSQEAEFTQENLRNIRRQSIPAKTPTSTLSQKGATLP